LNHLIVFSGWNRPKDDTERLASCLNFCGFFQAWLSRLIRFQVLTEAEHLPKPKPKARPKPQDWQDGQIGELVGLMGSRRGND